ncbi:MAG: EFR1 family ferrodoxin [Desulfobacterales bacterium]|nr:EFR1 family ferrodoxin [Desulfobacterales bacterium]
MKNRRDFIKAGAVTAVALSVPATAGCITIKKVAPQVPMKPRETGNALVLWYSQTGYTRRHGRLLAARLETHGYMVTASEIRDFRVRDMERFDLVVIGSPVFYYDTPDYVKTWIRALPDLKGTPVAAYVTFGGPEGNQDNAACSILDLLTQKNGVPVGARTFMNMSSFPLAWAGAEVDKKTWKSRHLPDGETYDRVREYARFLTEQLETGNASEFSKQLTAREMVTWVAPIYWTKKLVHNHSITEKECINCGTCVEKCPADAIDLPDYYVDTHACVLCFGCINNCPAGAVYMEYGGDRLVGYRDFMEKNSLTVTEPEELG